MVTDIACIVHHEASPCTSIQLFSTAVDRMNTLNYAKIGISARLNLESAGERWNAVVLCRILPKGIESLREKGCQKVLRLCLMCGKNTEDGTREGSQSCEWHLLLWRKDFSVCLGWGRLWGVSIAVGTAGNLGLPSRGPISWEEMGERTPEGRGSSLWTPFSGGCVGGRLYFSLVTWPAALTAKGPWRPAHRLGGLGM